MERTTGRPECHVSKFCTHVPKLSVILKPCRPQRISEQIEYSESMRDTWLQFLHEEVTLLKVGLYPRCSSFYTLNRIRTRALNTLEVNRPNIGPLLKVV